MKIELFNNTVFFLFLNKSQWCGQDLSKIETSVLLRGTFYSLIRLLFLIIFLCYFCIELTLLLSCNQIDTKVVISIKYGWNTLPKKSYIWDIIHTRMMSQMGTKQGHKNYRGTNPHWKFFGTTILVIIFWHFTMFHYRSELRQVKQNWYLV